MYTIIKQFIVGSDIAWVVKLDENDPIYEFDTEEEAQTKADELQSNDLSGRKYRVYRVN